MPTKNAPTRKNWILEKKEAFNGRLKNGGKRNGNQRKKSIRPFRGIEVDLSWKRLILVS